MARIPNPQPPLGTSWGNIDPYSLHQLARNRENQSSDHHKPCSHRNPN
uniref:Uncharacterized protein n=1 Tax=Arundo donax TaxID=35708 RepID=A0A0A9AQW4_ARUDO